REAGRRGRLEVVAGGDGPGRVDLDHVSREDGAHRKAAETPDLDDAHRARVSRRRGRDYRAVELQDDDLAVDERVSVVVRELLARACDLEERDRVAVGVGDLGDGSADQPRLDGVTDLVAGRVAEDDASARRPGPGDVSVL